MSEVHTITQDGRAFRCGLLPMKEMGCTPLYKIVFKKGDTIVFGGKEYQQSVKDEADCSIVGYMSERPKKGMVPFTSIVQGSKVAGYVFPTHKDSTGVSLLKMYYSRGRCDHAAVATSAGEQDLLLSLGDKKHEYYFDKPIGSIEVSPIEGTTPLFRMWHGHHLNSTLAAKPETIDTLTSQGYCKVRIEGHIFTSQTFFTSPLQILYHEGMKDSAASCDPKEVNTYTEQGYIIQGIEGYVYH
eukprot:TRINITY_DN1418_c4_g1_i1.p1 TRINITY_DN1418_c4_g1~~TRINITY_DN1418_c4_g1_i1.p1  ORF type:complete len:242 (+),score=47.80 TRINITY_DN1418_c4_g1_i1:137-862(+)